MTKNNEKYVNEAGVPHWKWQRRSALVLIPLTLWMLVSLIHHLGAEFTIAQHWVSQPVVAVLLVVFIIVLFHHAKLGLQTIIEDYISTLSSRKAFLSISNSVCWLAMFAGVVSVLKIALNP